MAVNPKEIETLLKEKIPHSFLEVQDLVGDGDHLQAIVVSQEFDGKTLLEQHQLVYGVLKDVLKQDLHALALKTFTPEQWDQTNS